MFAALRLVAYAGLIAFSAQAQLVTNTTQIPFTAGKPPVVFLNGYQGGCNGDSSFAITFGKADQLLQRDGRVSLFFNNCEQARNASIEELGNVFARYLDGLRYTTGQPVPEVDVIVHSMGGLIVRCYLSGKQQERGVFRPPAESKVRKAVFMAVPNFGALASILAGNDADLQTKEMLPGSPFLFDLATWNQGTDDLRSMDAVAIVGNAGTGVIPPLQSGFDDSTVSLTSGSMEWARPGKTRVVNYCHTALSGLLSLGCRPNTSIAEWNDDQHQAARIALSFLNGTSDWQSIGQNITEATTRGGIFVQLRDATDQGIALDSGLPVQIRDGEIAWNDRLEAVPLEVRLATRTAGSVGVQVQVPRGTTAAIIAKTAGPSIAAVFPSPAAVTPRAVAPGMFVSIYGPRLAPSEEFAGTVPLPTMLASTQVLVNGAALALNYAGPTQINAVVPGNASGLMRMTVVTGTGQQTVNVLVEPAVPTLFGIVFNAVTFAPVTASAPAQRADYLGIYLTGLGATERRGELDWALLQPQVTVGGQPCAVSYAGRAPGFPGVDQINCQVAANAATGDSSQITVTSGRRTGTGTVALR